MKKSAVIALGIQVSVFLLGLAQMPLNGAEFCVPTTVKRKIGDTKAVLDAAAPVWMTDFDAATKKAKAENKDLLLVFEGSDWCPWCKKLDGEVLSKPDFLEKVQKNFVLVRLDFPHNKPLPQEISDRNNALSEKFKIGGYPAVVLLQPESSDPYLKTGYVKELSADTYASGLVAARESNKSKRPSPDASALAAYKTQMNAFVESADATKDPATRSAELRKIISGSEAFMKTPDLGAESKQRAWMFKAYAHYHLMDFEMTNKDLDAAEALDPSGSNELSGKIKKFRAAIQKK